MPPSSFLETVRDLIGDNDVDAALQELAAGVTSADARNDLLILRRRWSEIVRKEESNSEHGHVLSVEKSKFTRDLLRYVDRLEPGKPESFEKHQSAISPWKIVVGISCLVLLAISVFWGIRDWKNDPVPPPNIEGLSRQPDDRGNETDSPPNRNVADDLTSFDSEQSEYFMPNTSDHSIAVAVYFSEGLDLGGFNETFTRQIIKLVGWGEKATPKGFKNKFHQSSLRTLLFSNGNRKDGELPPFFPADCPYDFIVLISINGDLAWMPAEASIVSWDVKAGKPVYWVPQRNFRRMMGDDGTLSPGEDFYNELVKISTLIAQR